MNQSTKAEKAALLVMLAMILFGVIRTAEARVVYFREEDGGMTPRDWDGGWPK